MSAGKKTVAQAPAKKVVTLEKTLDVTPESETEEVAEKTGLYTDNHSMKAKVSCKTKAGHEIKQGEKGYEECIKNVKNENSDVKVEFEK
jgi:hypothetical protein